MDLVLEKILPNSAIGRTANVDLFDASGILLLKKGQFITNAIRKRLERREVYLLRENRDTTSLSNKSIKKFPRDAYIKLVGSLWNIFHGAKLIDQEKINKTVELVETILFEFQDTKVYLNLDAVRLDLEKFKQHDYGTFIHVLNVALLSAITGIQLGYRDKRLKFLTLGALLHDLGKIKLPQEIINKPGSLTDEEFDLVKKHPLYGEQMLKNVHLLPRTLATVKEHHERWNGSGYPYGLKGNSIHLDAQIVAVTDVYEALTADRPYRKGLPPYHVLEMIIAWSGNDFNPLVVQAFQESLILYPEKSIVTLNTNEVGLVIAVPIQMPTRPLIRLLFDKEGRYLNQELYIDLMKDLTRFVERVEFKG